MIFEERQWKTNHIFIMNNQAMTGMDMVKFSKVLKKKWIKGFNRREK
jgi:hypothetical protein